MKWEYKDNRPRGFECWFAKWGKNYEIDVYQIGENRYSVGWYHKGCRVIKEHIDADNFDEAKSFATSIVRNYFHQMATYWNNMEHNFIKWAREDI